MLDGIRRRVEICEIRTKKQTKRERERGRRRATSVSLRALSPCVVGLARANPTLLLQRLWSATAPTWDKLRLCMSANVCERLRCQCVCKYHS